MKIFVKTLTTSTGMTITALLYCLLLMAFTSERVAGKVAAVGSENRLEFGSSRSASMSYNATSDEFMFDRDVRAPNLDALAVGPALFSGNYNDLTNQPALFSGSYNDLTNQPALSIVATSGNYNDVCAV